MKTKQIAFIDIPTNPEYWGNTTTADEAQRAADALEDVLTEGARRMGINAEISQSKHGNQNRDDLPDTESQQFLNSLNEFAWQHDCVQASAFEQTSVDASLVLRDYNDYVVRNGGKRRKELD